VSGGWGTSRPRDTLTFADLAAGVGQWEGCRAAGFRAGHEATVDLALLMDRKWGLGMIPDDQPWGLGEPPSQEANAWSSHLR
jgi:hypothetical protein